MMHFKANTDYKIDNNFYNNIIGQCGRLVLLFMLISAFSMCCGYFDRIRNGQISIDSFYKKRYHRIWPFFALLVIIDLLLNHSISALYEAFADLTLCFGLLPNPDIQVIGVGWFLGVVFLFYMLFPFFCFLIGNKRRAWLSFVISILYYFVCIEYFFDSKHVLSGGNNILSFAPFFLSGGSFINIEML